jgi:hypothetical protein
VSETLVYLYSVAGPDASGWVDAEHPKGLERRAVRVVTEGELSALVSDVAADAYGQDALDANVRDGRWLTPRATTHQAVNAAAHAATAAVLPVPFGTIYRTDDRVREMLRSRAEELRAKIVTVRGQAEWVVGVHRDLGHAAEHLSQQRDAMLHREHVAVGGPGRRYLEDRKAETAARADLRGLDDEAAASAQQIVSRVSRHVFVEPVVEDAGDLIARFTYLVRGSDEHRLHDAVEHFNSDWGERGYELRLTGPWPPYRSSGASDLSALAKGPAEGTRL